MSQINSAIYQGEVRHRRHLPTKHRFSYGLYMLALDLDELDKLAQQSWLFACGKFAPLNFRRSDYLGDEKTPLKTSVLEQVAQLGGSAHTLDRVVMLGQVRCFGFYFSPVNVFFCYEGQTARYALMEVHNTPWNERHCYLVDLAAPLPTDKVFHVSPFMDMNLKYHWLIKPPEERVLVHIENRNDALIFDATLSLKRHEFKSSALKAALMQWPIMTLTAVRGIYWQALQLFLKRVPFHPYSQRS